MLKKNKKMQGELQAERNDYTVNESPKILRKKTIKELIAPAGIDASNIDHLEIISNTKRYARSFFICSTSKNVYIPRAI